MKVYVLLTEYASLKVREFKTRDLADRFMLDFLLKYQDSEDDRICGIFEGKLSFLEDSVGLISEEE